MMAYCARKKLYRSPRGKIFGVCQGIADWKNLPVGYIRIFMVLAFLFTGFFPIGLLYFLAALVLPTEPECSREDRFEDEGAKDCYDKARRDFSRMKDKVDNREGRGFDKERDWEERFKKRD